jgi:PAS domain S-box-containing protein
MERQTASGYDAAVRPSVLIVDDEPDITCALRDLLEHKGYRADIASTGAASLSLARERRYAAVLLDIGLPDLNGLCVLKRLQELDPKLPVIIITAYTNEEETVGALRQGAFAYIIKPYNPDELQVVLRRAVGVQALAVKAERVERDLTASEERFKSIVQTANDAIILADRRGAIVFWNDAARTLFGYTQEEAVGQPLTLIIPPRYRDAHRQGFERLQSTGQARILGRTIEVYGLRKDRQEFPAELSLGRGLASEETFYSGIIRDISERKQAEHAMSRLAAIVESSNDAIISSTLDGIIVTWNRGAERLYGYTAEEMQGQSVAVLVPEDRRHEMQSVLGRIQRDEMVATMETVRQRKDGRLLTVCLTVSPLKDAAGHVFGASAIVRDITEEKEAESQLRESQERFRQLIELIGEVFWLSDPGKTRILYVSPAYEQIWGRSCASLYASPQSWLDAIHPEDRERVRAASLTRQISGEYCEEYRIVRPDRTVRWIRDRAFPVRNDKGEIYRLAGLAQDITANR